MKSTVTRSIVGSVAAFVLCAVGLTGCWQEGPCRSALEAGSTYHVSLQAKTATEPHYSPSNTSTPSCVGVDNLAATGGIDVAIPRNAAHAEFARNQCWALAGEVASDIGLPLGPADHETIIPIDYGSGPMVEVSGTISNAGCTGSWAFTVVDDPGDAYNHVAPHRWAGRYVTLDGTNPACRAAYPTVGTADVLDCYDEWDVDVQAK